jgi:hypothetical protein
MRALGSLAVVGLCAALAACGSGGDSAPTNAAGSTGSTSSTATTASTGATSTATTSTGTTSATDATSTDAVRVTVLGFLTAYKEKRYEDAVELMTPAAQREIAGNSSGDVAAKAAKAFATYRDLVPDKELDRAIARVDTMPIHITGTKATTRDLEGSREYLVYRDGRWLIADARGR